MNTKQIISILVSLNLLLNNLIAASIEIDTNASTKNQASLRNAQNGVQIVDIVNPNSNGTSHNKFRNFNVEQQGVILNNSKVITKTQLAGYISDNRNLQNNANLILNEVTSTNKTLLEGYTEVAGKTADVIVANPNGISVNGGGFINSNNVTLTTGKPNFIVDYLNGFDITSGNININGNGLNVNNIDRVNLYSKALSLNAKIYAEELNIATGEKLVDTNGNITSKDVIGSDVAIDSTALGGIYANKISLESSDKGVGVNLPNEVFAQDRLTLDANGKIKLKKTKATNSLSINSKTDSIEIDDSLYSKNITLKATDTISTKNDSDLNIIAENNLNIKSNKLENKANIYSGYDQNLIDLNSNSSNNIDIKTLENSGTIQAQNLNLSLNNIKNSGTINTKETITLDVNNDIKNNGFIIANNLDINSNTIENNGALYSKNNINLETIDLDNFEMIRSNSDIDLFVADTMNNSGMIYSDGNLTIAANENYDRNNTINNTKILQSNKDINLYTSVLNNKADIPTITKSTTKSTTKSGSGNNYNITTKIITNHNIDINSIRPSLILANGDINIDVNTLNNIYSLISSDQNVVLNANTVNNVGKVLVQTIKTVTKMYRDEKYCSSSGPSGVCFNHKNRAAYRGTKTSITTKKTPVINFGIQATNSITGNVITLNNLNDQLAGALADSEITNKLNEIDTINTNSVDLQTLTSSLTKNNSNNMDIITNSEDIDTLVNNIVTNEDVLDFKDSLNSFKDTLKTNIDNAQSTINSLETVLTYIKTQSNANVNSTDITNIETSIQTLKDNIIKNLDYINSFKTINDQIETLDDVTLGKDELKNLNTSINGTFSSNKAVLDNLNNNGYINNVVGSLETKSNNLRDEVNIALDLKSNIEYKIINNQEGLYKVNTSTSMQDEILDNTIPTKITSTDLSQVTQNSINIPKNEFGLFVTVDDINHKYLIESNPVYTNYDTFISSDYMLGKLELDPNKIVKRLADGLYETNLIKNVVIKSTGKRYLNGYTSDKQQFQALMDNAISLKNDLNLTFGISLSKEQVSLLNKDIVWMEEKIVDGQNVLVPQLYFAKNRENIDGVNFEAQDISLSVETLNNNGFIVADNNLNIQSKKNIFNQNGKIVSGNDLELIAQNDIKNESGTIQSGNDLTLQASNNINISTSNKKLTNKREKGLEHLTQIGDSSNIIAGNDLKLNANNINIINTNIEAENLLSLNSVENTKISSLEQKSNYSFNFGNGYSKGAKLVNRKSTLDAKNIDVNADNLIIKSSDLKTKENINLSGVNNVSVLANNDYEQSDIQITTSSGFMGKKTTKDALYKESTVSSNINGKNITITSEEANITLEAAKLKADENIVIDAKKDIEVVAKQYREGNLHYTKKSSWGGLSQSASMDRTDALNTKEAKLQTEALNIILKSGNDIKILGSNIEAASDVQIQATKNVLVGAVQELLKKEEWSRKSSFNLANLIASLGTLGLVDVGPIYEMQYKLQGSDNTLAKSSNISSGGDININAGNAKIVGSNINAINNINTTTDIGSIEVLTAKEEKNSYSKDKKIEVKMGNILKSVASFAIPKDSKLKLTLAQATYDNTQNNEQQTVNKISNVVSNEGNIGLDSTKNINIEGSNIETNNGNINLSAEQNVNIKEAMNTSSNSSKETHAEAEISATIQNEYVEAAKAYKEVSSATKQLKQTKKDYKDYKNTVSKLESNLATLKQKLKNKTPGLDKEDIDELAELISDIKGDEKYYLAAIAAATVNLKSKTTIAVQQTATAAASSGTYGFSAGVSFDVAGSKTTTNSSSTKAIASNLSGNNITIKTRNDLNNQTNISGSNLKAKENLSIETRELNIASSQDTSSTTSKEKDISGSVSMTMYGAATGPQVSLGYGQSSSENSTITNNNSQLNAQNITITTTQDTNLKGANVNASELLTMIVRGDLSVESQRDTYNSNSKGSNVSAGFGLDSNSNLSSVNTGYGASNGRTKVKQTVLTSVTGKEVDVQVDNNTNLKGSLLASGEYDANGNFKDNKNLNLITDTLTYQNSTNRVYDSSKSFDVGVGLGFGEKKNDDGTTSDNTSLTTANLGYSNSNTYSKSKTLATLGQGDVTVNDTANSDDTSVLNRDVTKTNKELYSAKTGVKVDMTLDGRLLTEDGRKQIAKDYEGLNKNMNIIAGTLPDENSDNKIEAAAGKVWNSLTKYLTLGLILSNENRGGIIAQIPVLTGESDNAYKQLLVVNELSDKFNENSYIKMEDSNYYKALTQEDKLKFNGKGLYVSKTPVEINTQTATYQNSINGMMNNEAESIKNGLEQTGQMTKGKPVELTVAYNPSYGMIPDLLESAVDKSGIGTTGIAKQVGTFIDEVTMSRGSEGSNIAMHSQANPIVYNGIQYVQENGGYKPKEYFYAGVDEDGNEIYKTPTFVSFGSPMNKDEMNKVIGKDGLKYKYLGAYTKKGDFVGEVIGGNKGDNGQATLSDKLNILNAYKLFTSDSPHSTYICQNYADQGVQCGYRK